MRRAHRRCRGLRCAGPAGAGLWLVLTQGAAPAATAPTQTPDRPEVSLFEDAGGQLTHALTYRPERPASRAIVLARGETRAGEETCWGPLAEELRRAGWWVIVPDPGLGPAVYGPSQGEATAPLAPPIVLGDSTGLFVAVICAGSAGNLGTFLTDSGVRVGAVAWILPEAGPLPWGEGSSPADPPRLLLVAAQKRPASLALASDLFTRFNRVAELWLLSWGETDCELLAAQRHRRSLRGWLEAAVARAAREDGQPAAAGSASGREPGR